MSAEWISTATMARRWHHLYDNEDTFFSSENVYADFSPITMNRMLHLNNVSRFRPASNDDNQQQKQAETNADALASANIRKQ